VLQLYFAQKERRMNNETIIKKIIAAILAMALFMLVGGTDAALLFTACLILYAVIFGIADAASIFNPVECIMLLSLSGLLMMILPSNFDIFAMLMVISGVWLAVLNIWSFRSVEGD
jgi:hypothetical protein